MRSVVFQTCIPILGAQVPAGKDWLHEINHDGYRLIVQRENKRCACSPAMVTQLERPVSSHHRSGLTAPFQHIRIDGEPVLLGVDGISDFNACSHASTMTKCSFVLSID
jgi:bifunctional non-homologous end joining protein LigD